ncbi:MAG: CDP-diacylglycerol--serine O-phosphatidyltransferase [Prevotellaceae bacterium]|jgi:CDP-diacylglycerol--serine O-phosphatidyltransferase|nr:CDP-diacylglycerol--serine O-phosphatidyltransferase [Prevotellaceae bacterium]
MKPLTYYIPNSITLLNLLFGCVAVILALRGWTSFAGYCIFMAAVCDFLDGLSARLLKAYSEMGKQLDSLADMVSFGVAPGVMLYQEMYRILSPRITMGFDTVGWELLLFAPFILTLFSALRLAKFNIDARQREGFLGLPTPACALLVASFLIYARTHSALDPFIHEWSLLGAVVALSALMVVNLPMPAMKFKGLAWASNKLRYVFLLICAAIVLFTLVAEEDFTLAVVLIILSYILYSLCLYAGKLVKKN